jgi:hypothetical protein
MKNLLKVLLIVIPALLLACDGNDNNQFSHGKIVGYDLTLCACCGGYVIEIDGETYRFFDEDIQGTNPLDAWTMNYPVYVLIEWSPKTGACDQRINVQKVMTTREP